MSELKTPAQIQVILAEGDAAVRARNMAQSTISFWDLADEYSVPAVVRKREDALAIADGAPDPLAGDEKSMAKRAEKAMKKDKQNKIDDYLREDELAGNFPQRRSGKRWEWNRDADLDQVRHDRMSAWYCWCRNSCYQRNISPRSAA